MPAIRVEDIANPATCDNVARLLRIFLDLLSKLADIDLDVVDLVINALDSL